MSDIIRLEDISVAFDDEIILDKLNLSIRDKEFVTLLGPSGCGKTTTLRIIGGFQHQDSGDVYFDNQLINDQHIFFLCEYLIDPATVMEKIISPLMFSVVFVINQMSNGLFVSWAKTAMSYLTKFSKSCC